MFAKNKPVKRVNLNDGQWVDLQHLSKGIKDSFKNALAGGLNGGMEISLEGDNAKPKGISLSENFLEKINEINYRKMVAAIKDWSAKDGEGNKVPIDEEMVKELDEETFDKILEEINGMNELSAVEEKN